MAKQALVKDQEKFVVRLPEGMRDQLKAAADAKSWSLNAEIVSRIELAETVRGVKLDFELAKQRILDLQQAADNRDKLVEVLTSALDQAKERERALQAQVDRLHVQLDAATLQQARLLEMLDKKMG